ncbi:MAG: hypothetical protein ACI8YQ_001092 [Polaribacter sp.]|jgi:uncharacterized protein (DUF2141 family)
MKLPFLFLISLFYLNTCVAQSASLTVTIQNLKSTKGNILIGLYNKAEGFSKDENAIKGATVAVTETTVSYTFKDLPADGYALALFHDSNSDGKMNTNMVGFPKENYGFSNNAFGNFGTVPGFEEAKVTVGEGERKEIVVELR